MIKKWRVKVGEAMNGDYICVKFDTEKEQKEYFKQWFKEQGKIKNDMFIDEIDEPKGLIYDLG